MPNFMIAAKHAKPCVVNLLQVGTIAIDRDVTPHPLLGDAHVIVHDGRAITAMSAIDWQRPARIPVVAEPSCLPPGAGGELLNYLATIARDAGVPALRYAGPYPTPALYRALLRSFRASHDETTFARDVLSRALRVARDEVPVDFTPAPHGRVAIAGGHVERRDGVERVVIDGVTYAPDGSPARLVRAADGWSCEVWFGDERYAEIATLSDRGELRAGPRPVPALESRVLGQRFPSELCAAIAELVAECVATPFADDARHAVASRALTWRDLGARVAVRERDGFAVHAALWERIAPKGLARLALALAEALAPVVATTLVGEWIAARAR
jgi:hypothetical protein